MRVAVFCEESQTVTKAFRKRGHEAYSFDLQDCSGGQPEWHIKGNALDHLNEGWDLAICHPPCTHLAVSGAAWFKQKIADGRQQQGIDLFMAFTKTSIPKVCIENPVGIMSRIYRKPDQILNPYHFGDPYQKATCLWLTGLPKLSATCINAPLFGESVDKGEMTTFASGKVMPTWYAQLSGNGGKRSVTFPRFAEAMAEQWGSL